MQNQSHRSVIDVHTHFGPAAAATVRRVMDANGLSHVVNLGMLERLGIPFEEGMRAFRDALGERMVYFATPDFADKALGFGERMADELERKVALGAGGLKIFKELGLRIRDAEGALMPVDDPRLDPLWDRAGALGVPVLIHTADPLAFFGPLDEHNERWEELQQHPDWHFGQPGFTAHDDLLEQRNRVLARHPRTTFIGAHLGEFPENLAYVDGCLTRYPNFLVDVCARIGEIGRHPADEARAFFIKHQDRILFGTDFMIDDNEDGSTLDPAEVRRFYDLHWAFFETDAPQIEYPGFPIQGRWKVDALGLPPAVLSKLYVMNARRAVPAIGG